MNVPAWPIPIHQTKSVIANAHATGMLFPHDPIPFATVQVIEKPNRTVPRQEMAKRIHHRGDAYQSGARR